MSKITFFKQLLIFNISMLFSTFLFAQEGFFKLSGVVLDKTGEPLPDVNIKFKNNIVGTVTEKDGTFQLNLASPNTLLIFTSIGYQTQEVDPDGKKFLSVILEDEFTQLQDAVVVGYGTQKKSVVTGAISSVKNKDFRDQPVVNIAQSIQSKVSGVNVTTPSGTPGAGLLVNIRGSFNPLYVIDGVPIVSESNTALSNSYDLAGNSTGQTQNISSLADINPNDVESVEILKDASAAAIYGVRGANGVVLITTKRGTSDKTEFGVNTYTGIQDVIRRPQYLSSSEMVELIEDARQQDLKLYQQDPNVFGADFNPEILTKPLPASWKTGQNTVWLDEVFRRAPINNVEVYARGGNTRTRFHISGNYFNQVGTVLNSSYKRYTGRINLDHRVGEHLTIGNTLNLTRSLNERVANDDTYSGILTNANGADPLMPPYDKDGNYSEFTDYHTNWLSDNPMKSALEIEMNTISNRVLGSVFAEYRFNNALKFKTTWSLDYTDMNDTQFFDPSTTDAETTFGRAFYASYNNVTFLGENYFTYKKSILEDHNLEIIAGTSIQKSSSKNSQVSGENFPVGYTLENLTNAAVITRARTTGTEWGILSYIGRVNYDFKNRIIAGASFRVDGSSRFNKENRFAAFPSLSLGYRLIRTSDIDPNNNPLLSDLKFRVSYGKTGDQELGNNYPNRNQWGAAPYLGQQGLAQVVLADPTLGWQENTIINAGIDFEFLKGRYGGSVEVFNSSKSKLLNNAIIAGTTGFQTVAQNIGIINNKGFEMQLFGTPINTGKFRWTIQANATILKNTLEKTAQDGELVYAYSDISPLHILKEGESIGTFYGLKWTGVDPATGTMTYEDVNKDGLIDLENDGQVLGKALPTFFGGLNFTFNYLKFDLNIANQFSMGNKVFNYNRFYYNSLGWANEGWNDKGELLSAYSNSTVAARNRWRNPGDITDVPRASLVNRSIDYDNSSYFLESAAFWRIRTINLGYTVRPANTKRFSSARFYVQLQNPFIFTNYSWFDPEISSTGGGVGQEKTAGVDLATYPHARTSSIGVNVIF